MALFTSNKTLHLTYDAQSIVGTLDLRVIFAVVFCAIGGPQPLRCEEGGSQQECGCAAEKFESPSTGWLLSAGGLGMCPDLGEGTADIIGQELQQEEASTLEQFTKRLRPR